MPFFGHIFGNNYSTARRFVLYYALRPCAAQQAVLRRAFTGAKQPDGQLRRLCLPWDFVPAALLRGPPLRPGGTAVSLVLAPIAFGAVQARVSEAFTLLPVLVPDAVVGVTLGCFLTNLVGVFTGANVLGALDIVFGTAATLTAALCTRRLARVRLRGLPVAAAVPPVLINAVVVGAELAWAFGPRTFAGFLLQAGGVALGQLFSCFALGLPLVRIIEKTPALRAWFRD